MFQYYAIKIADIQIKFEKKNNLNETKKTFLISKFSFVAFDTRPPGQIITKKIFKSFNQKFLVRIRFVNKNKFCTK